jgi:hypothetical protein
MRRIYRNGILMFGLSALSISCLLFLLELWAYAGSPFPQTQGASPSEARWLWAEWSLLFPVPLITAILWLLRISDPTRR